MWPGTALGTPEALFVTSRNIDITFIDRVVGAVPSPEHLGY